MDDTSEVLEISALNWVEFAERMSEDRSRGSYDKITKATGFFSVTPSTKGPDWEFHHMFQQGNKSPCSLLMTQISRIGRDMFDWTVGLLAHNLILQNYPRVQGGRVHTQGPEVVQAQKGLQKVARKDGKKGKVAKGAKSAGKSTSPGLQPPPLRNPRRDFSPVTALSSNRPLKLYPGAPMLHLLLAYVGYSKLADYAGVYTDSPSNQLLTLIIETYQSDPPFATHGGEVRGLGSGPGFTVILCQRLIYDPSLAESYFQTLCSLVSRQMPWQEVSVIGRETTPTALAPSHISELQGFAGSVCGFVYQDMAVRPLGLNLLRSLASSVVDSAQILLAPGLPQVPSSSLKTLSLGRPAPYPYSSFSFTDSTVRETSQERNRCLTREQPPSTWVDGGGVFSVKGSCDRAPSPIWINSDE
ncbi:hypothetical protein B0H13DRAFT_1851938 [Mycena leptocephala]|nr:hypothetical protein B0H13DRAFT_1851938 [Mycena leptocephala]